jgi:hypothetical protein
MSARRTKSRRRSGHPARVAERQRPQVTAKSRPSAPQAPRPRKRPAPRGPARGWDLGLRARLRRAWIALLEAMLLGSRARRSRAREQPPQPHPQDGREPSVTPGDEAAGLPEITALDLAWALGTAAAGAALFATVLTSFPWLGDAPETVTGVSTLGILHDPGYPSYVLAAHLFTLLIPAGSEAFKVNLFSLVCASANVGAVQLLGRRLGATRWAASLGALVLASSAGFWFYSGFAKHDMFSGLLFMLSLHALLAWRARPSMRRLVALAAVIAIGLGSSWPLEVLIFPAVGFVLAADRRRLSALSLSAAIATGIALLVAIYGFVMIRAAQHPAIDWGDASTPSRLIALVRRTDFTAHGSSASGVAAASGGSSAAHAGHAHAVHLLGSVGGAVATFARELGMLGVLLALFGLVASVGWRRGRASWPVLIACLTNLIGAGVVVNFGAGRGSLNGDLIDEGFVLGAYFALAGWMALGAGELVRLAPVAASRLPGRLRPRFPGSPAGGEPRPLARARRLLGATFVVALAAALIAPLIAGKWSAVHRSDRPFADRYAQAAFAELPPHAALFVMGAELTQPLIYRQVVYHQRRDVAVIAADGVEYGWYRAQLSRRLGIALPPASGSTYDDDARLIRAVARIRPVYLDPQAAQQLSSLVGYRPVGLLDQLAGGHGPQPVRSPAAVEARLLAAERESLFPSRNWSLWPSDYVDQAEYATAALKLAQAFYQRHDLAGMRRALLNDLSVDPGDPIAERDLSKLESSGFGGG